MSWLLPESEAVRVAGKPKVALERSEAGPSFYEGS
jgi:hypothetical protein